MADNEPYKHAWMRSPVAHFCPYVCISRHARQLRLHTPDGLIPARQDFVFKQRAHGAPSKFRMKAASAFLLTNVICAMKNRRAARACLRKYCYLCIGKPTHP